MYEWNARAAGAIIQTVALAEVLLRNAMDERLTEWAQRRPVQASWLSTVPLDPRGLADISAARLRATNKGRYTEVQGKVIAEFSFGFWRYMVARRYLTTLWLPALKDAFPHGDPNIGHRRAQVERTLSSIGFVRNRAAHHEPIHRRNLMHDLACIISLCQWIHPDAGAWVAASSTLPQVAAERTTLRI
ncbi:MAG TPA: hypothetical protein PKE40_11240 [Arachnia sp.]|nr:hypothetical protein [Arachnia sp.]HMT86918.1 hypothetical protein [Arachnia sp.]